MTFMLKYHNPNDSASEPKSRNIPAIAGIPENNHLLATGKTKQKPKFNPVYCKGINKPEQTFRDHIKF